MDLNQFVKNNVVDKCNARIDMETLEKAEQIMGIKCGEELIEYITQYGYLAYEYIELYGMNSRQGLDSDLVKQTLYLHKYFPATIGFIAIENQGEGLYAIVNSEDEVYLYDSESDTLNKTNNSLFSYILERFQNA